MRNFLIISALFFSSLAFGEECADFSGKWMFQGCEDKDVPAFIEQYDPLVIRQQGCSEIKIVELMHLSFVKTTSSPGAKEHTVRHADWDKSGEKINYVYSIYSRSGNKSSSLSLNEGQYYIDDQERFVISFKTESFLYDNLIRRDEKSVVRKCRFNRI